jgi:2-hydroxychromene-2-carboxylate isomerase
LSLVIDYYLAPQSPWTYFGHARWVQMAQQAGATVRIMPVDLGGQIFPATGGLPVGQRSPQRQAYRMVELQRFSHFLQMPLNLKPQFFPVAGDDAARLIIAVDQHDGVDAALKVCGAVLAAVWVQERDIANASVLQEILHEQGIAADRWTAAQGPAAQDAYMAYTRQALDVGVFGAPSFVVNGEIFWGQDRLEFLQRRLQAA